MSQQFSTTPFHKKIDKPWGYEIIYTPEGLSYAGKILFLKAGKKFSFQYHDEKIETIVLFSGKALIWLETAAGEIEKVPMEQGKGYTVALRQKHRVEAMEDCFLFESSPPESGTTFRVEDDFSREDETEAMRDQENRGWKPAT